MSYSNLPKAPVKVPNSFSVMLSLFKSNQSVSVCLPNNEGYWQDWIRRPSATTILSGTWREHSAKHFQFLFGVAHSLSYMLDPCNLGHGLPILLCHSLENTLFESPEDKVMPSNASQHELLCMQYPKFFIVTSQQKNKKLFCYKVLLKGPKIPLEYWLGGIGGHHLVFRALKQSVLQAVA